jgi:hypothetical protein
VSALFTRRAAALILGLSFVSLATAVALWIVGPEPVPEASARADAFSSSAIGHRAFIELLRALRVPVVLSRYDSGHRAGRSAVLLLAEPRLTPQSGQAWEMGQLVGSAHTVLLILPKWDGREDPRRPGRIASAELLPLPTVNAILQAAALPASVSRGGSGGTQECGGAPGPIRLESPQFLAAEAAGPARSLVTCAGGILAAEFSRPTGGRVLVLSDPDLISNHGLGREANAMAAVALVEAAREGRRAIVVDETLHGYRQSSSVWRSLLGPPLLPSVLLALIAGLLLVWAGARRFGAPLPPEPTLASGKSALIENTASLLQLGRHSGHTLGRYLEAAVQDVARALHVPGADGPGVRGRLTALGRRRGATDELPALEASVERAQRGTRVEAGPVLAAARRVHRWRKEMLFGPQRSGGA